jgi:hypothetical protein
MKSIDQIIKIAERFAIKLSLAQAIVGEDPKSVVADAFFGPNEENIFQQFILNPNSHFSKILPESVKSVDIGATVDAKSKAANFLVSTNPTTPPQLRANLINALKEDYKAKYGQYPADRFAERLSQGQIKPPTVHETAVAIIHIT